MLTVRFAVFGPVAAENEHGPINLGGRRHRAVLARLLVARGRVVPVGRLIDDLWSDAPAGALGAVQTFVGALRKAIEPDRARRTPARLLVTVPPGYALRTGVDMVDAWRFEDGVARSARLLTDGMAAEARILLDELLGLWRGPAYAEFADQDWARAEAARLEDLRLVAVGRRAEAAIAVGAPADAVADLELLVEAHPHREEGWRMLGLALYRSGRQGDALATLRKARAVLLGELGVDPGPDLRRLESDILSQAAHLDLPPDSAGQQRQPPPPSRAVAEPAGHPFVGRAAELTALEAAATSAVASSRPTLALLSGVAGAGKSALARTLTGRLADAGWITVVAASLEIPGAVAAGPLSHLQNALGANVFDVPLDDIDLSSSDPATARSGRIRSIVARLMTAAEQRPVLVVFDDLHWADEETLAVFAALAAQPEPGAVLIVGTFRSTEIGTGLAQALGRVARQEPSRIYLAGLTPAEVREMLAGITSREMTPDDAAKIHERSAGNPFFVRELAGLWETDGDAAFQTVPTGVRDVIRHRFSGLPHVARLHLRQAAVMGQHIDLDRLIAIAGEEGPVLDSVESAVLGGFLVEEDDNRLRFAHALVQETIYQDISRGRRARWHASVADIIERANPGDVEAIAHHLLRAGSRGSASRTAHFAGAAARRSEQRFAPREAATWWRATISALDRSPAEPRGRLDAVMGLVRALALSGDLEQARQHRGQAIDAAELLGDPLLTAEVIGAFDVPAIWTTNDDEVLSARLVAAAERTLTALPTSRRLERARLLASIAMERRADSEPRGEQAAGEAETIARELGDPAVLALALNGRFLQTFQRAGLAGRRAQIGEELLDVALRNSGLVTFEVLGHLILIQARAALADFGAADRHVAAVELLADRHDLPMVGVFTDWYAALRLAVTGRAQAALTAYRKAAGRLAGTGMFGIEAGILPLAQLCLSAPDAPSGVEHADWGPYESWARPLLLLGEGERGPAVDALRNVPDSPHDLLFEVRTCLQAMAAIELDERPMMARRYQDLLPAVDELAGAGSGLVTLGPTAQVLGDLAAALGNERHAAGHYRRALALAELSQAPHWAATARAALDRLGRQPV